MLYQGLNARKSVLTVHCCSSGLNYGIHHLSTSGSYQRWAELVDDESYSVDEFVPYFKRSVDFTAESGLGTPNATFRYNESAFLPRGGPLHLSYPNYIQPLTTWLDGPMLEAGIPLATDFSSGTLDGAKIIETAIDPTTHLRESAQTSFLDAVADNSRLKVFTYSVAERIVFDNLTATGVVINGSIISANKEVILSAGVFQSPQLLMLSGIGPAKHLAQHNIPVLLDKPGVGQNMVDHIFFGPSYEVKLHTYSPPELLQMARSISDNNQFGPLQSNNADYIAFEHIPSTILSSFTPSTRDAISDYPSDWPDWEYIPGANFVGNFSRSMPQPDPNASYASILITLVKATSRGTVTLASANPYDLPRIDPNWLTTRADQEVAIAAYRRVRQIFATEAMAPLLVEPGTEAWPGLDVGRTDEEILELVRNTLSPVWHAAGTCGMGRPTDPMAVVDSKARVFGTRGLRVVDASSFPLLPPGHPQATIYMLAEKIAQVIIDES